jgi:NADPH2:quinone reductase
VASSHERLAAARAAGASSGIVVDRGEPALDLRDIDIVFDPVGGPLGLAALRTLRRGGRYLIIGFVGGTAALPLNRALIKEIEVIGVRAGEYARQDPAAGRRHIAAIDARAALLRPQIGTTLPLEAAAGLFDAMAAGTLVGKAVVAVAP